MLLADPAYTVPSPPPPGPFGTIAWLRATVSRFSEGPTHARRRAIAESMLRDLDPSALRAAAADAARKQTRAEAVAPAATPTPPAAASPPIAMASTPASGSPPTATASSPAGVAVPLPYLPVAVLAAATGVAPGDVTAATQAARIVAAAYHPGTDAPGADDALARLLGLLPAAEPEVAAQHVALLVQACEATAALVRRALDRPLEDVLRDDPPVAVTRRLDPAGRLVTVDLAGHPFGAGPRACPGEAHARALAAGVVEGAR